MISCVIAIDLYYYLIKKNICYGKHTSFIFIAIDLYRYRRNLIICGCLTAGFLYIVLPFLRRAALPYAALVIRYISSLSALIGFLTLIRGGNVFDDGLIRSELGMSICPCPSAFIRRRSRCLVASLHRRSLVA